MYFSKYRKTRTYRPLPSPSLNSYSLFLSTDISIRLSVYLRLSRSSRSLLSSSLSGSLLLSPFSRAFQMSVEKEGRVQHTNRPAAIHPSSGSLPGGVMTLLSRVAAPPTAAAYLPPLTRITTTTATKTTDLRLGQFFFPFISSRP